MIKDVVLKLVFGVGKSKPTPLYPYIFHLYHSLHIVRRQEIVAYESAESMLKYDIRSDSKSKAKGEEDRKRESLSVEEIEALQALHKSPWKRPKHTFQVEKGSPLIRKTKKE